MMIHTGTETRVLQVATVEALRKTKFRLKVGDKSLLQTKPIYIPVSVQFGSNLSLSEL